MNLLNGGYTSYSNQPSSSSFNEFIPYEPKPAKAQPTHPAQPLQLNVINITQDDPKPVNVNEPVKKARSSESSLPAPKRQKSIPLPTTTSQYALSDKTQAFFDKQPPEIQVKYRMTALFQAYGSRGSISELVAKFVAIVLTIDIENAGTSFPDPFAVAFEVAKAQAPPLFWIGLLGQPKLLARVRNWLTTMFKNKKFDATAPCLEGLLRMSLTEDHLEKYKLNKVLSLLIKRGNQETRDLCNQLLSRAAHLTKVNAVAAKEPAVPLPKPTPEPAADKVAAKPRISQPPPKPKVVAKPKPAPVAQPAKKITPPAPASSASAGSSFFKSLQTPKPAAPKPAVPKPVEAPKPAAPPVLFFSSHMKSINESKKKEVKKSSSPEVAPKKKKKTVRWREDDELTEVKLFYLDPDEKASKLYRGVTGAKEMEYHEAVNAFKHVQTEPEQDEDVDWYTPRPINFETQDLTAAMLKTYPPRKGGTKRVASREAEIQAEREAHALIAIYMTESEIPDSPAEPDGKEEPSTEPKEIPLAPYLANHNEFKAFLASKDSFKYRRGDPVEPMNTLPNALTQLLSSLTQGGQFATAPPVAQPQPAMPAFTPDMFAQLQKNLSSMTMPPFNNNMQGNNLGNFQGNFQSNQSNYHGPNNTTTTNNNNNNNYQPQQSYGLGPKVLSLRAQDIRESVRQDKTTADKWKFPCKFYATHCGNGDACTFLHLAHND